VADSKNTPALIDNPAVREAMAKYGITPGELVAPQPTVAEKVNFDQLCTRTDEVRDPNGKVVAGMVGHTGPMVYIKRSEESADTRGADFKTRYDNYVGFYVYTVIHPMRGELVITSGIPADGPTDLQTHLGNLDRGNLFQVGMWRTSGGNRLFKPIPVQAA